jgi:hypothetical protein
MAPVGSETSVTNYQPVLLKIPEEHGRSLKSRECIAPSPETGGKKLRYAISFIRIQCIKIFFVAAV